MGTVTILRVAHHMCTQVPSSRHHRYPTAFHSTQYEYSIVFITDTLQSSPATSVPCIVSMVTRRWWVFLKCKLPYFSLCKSNRTHTICIIKDAYLCVRLNHRVMPFQLSKGTRKSDYHTSFPTWWSTLLSNLFIASLCKLRQPGACLVDRIFPRLRRKAGWRSFSTSVHQLGGYEALVCLLVCLVFLIEEKAIT